MQRDAAHAGQVALARRRIVAARSARRAPPSPAPRIRCRGGAEAALGAQRIGRVGVARGAADDARCPTSPAPHRAGTCRPDAGCGRRSSRGLARLDLDHQLHRRQVVETDAAGRCRSPAARAAAARAGRDAGAQRLQSGVGHACAAASAVGLTRIDASERALRSALSSSATPPQSGGRRLACSGSGYVAS